MQKKKAGPKTTVANFTPMNFAFRPRGPENACPNSAYGDKQFPSSQCGYATPQPALKYVIEVTKWIRKDLDEALSAVTPMLEQIVTSEAERLNAQVVHTAELQAINQVLKEIDQYRKNVKSAHDEHTTLLKGLKYSVFSELRKGVPLLERTEKVVHELQTMVKDEGIKNAISRLYKPRVKRSKSVLLMRSDMDNYVKENVEELCADIRKGRGKEVAKSITKRRQRPFIPPERVERKVV